MDALTSPEFACRILETRACPAIYEGVCGSRPCARYESEDETVWYSEKGFPGEYVAVPNTSAIPGL